VNVSEKGKGEEKKGQEILLPVQLDGGRLFGKGRGHPGCKHTTKTTLKEDKKAITPGESCKARAVP